MILPELPDLPRPVARGGGGCHLLALRDGVGTLIAACGMACGSMCGEVNYEDGLTHCPVHGDELCPYCREIVDTFEQTDRWDGTDE